MTENSKRLPINVFAMFSSLTKGSTKPVSGQKNNRCANELNMIDLLYGNSKFFCVLLLVGSSFFQHYEACRFNGSCPISNFVAKKSS